jgi:primary-amine oxidase
MDGNVIEWQNWKLHAGSSILSLSTRHLIIICPLAFSHKEGIALSTITYNDNGVIRPLFYRLSLVEMVVPYAAPEHPHPRKFAFDV